PAGGPRQHGPHRFGGRGGTSDETAVRLHHPDAAPCRIAEPPEVRRHERADESVHDGRREALVLALLAAQTKRTPPKQSRLSELADQPVLVRGLLVAV